MVSRVNSGGIRPPDSAVRSQSPALAQVARALAGRARELWELSAGESAVDGEDAAIARNPQNLYGVDLSGPPWGSALRHPVAWFSGREPTANVEQPDLDDVGNVIVTATKPAIIRMRYWVRPFATLPDPAIAPYSRGCVALRHHRKTGASTPTLTIRGRNLTLGQTWDTARSATFTASASEASEQFSNTFLVDQVPGWNEVVFMVTTTTGGEEYVIDSLTIYNLVKRSH